MARFVPFRPVLVIVATLSLAFASLPLVSPASALAAADTTVDPDRWRHPVDAPIVDYFRPPSGPYAAGNRGLEYGTRPGQVVVAVASGTVTFAGTVGGDRFVVVSHSPELRSTYAYLATVEVSAGDAVVAGQRIATAAAHFHLTARLRNRYVDPLGYMTLSWSVRLIANRSARGVIR